MSPAQGLVLHRPFQLLPAHEENMVADAILAEAVDLDH